MLAWTAYYMHTRCAFSRATNVGTLATESFLTNFVSSSVWSLYLQVLESQSPDCSFVDNACDMCAHFGTFLCDSTKPDRMPL